MRMSLGKKHLGPTQKRVTVRLPDALYAQAKQLADRGYAYAQVGEVLRDALEHYLACGDRLKIAEARIAHNTAWSEVDYRQRHPESARSSGPLPEIPPWPGA